MEQVAEVGTEAEAKGEEEEKEKDAETEAEAVAEAEAEVVIRHGSVGVAAAMEFRIKKIAFGGQRRARRCRRCWTLATLNCDSCRSIGLRSSVSWPRRSLCLMTENKKVEDQIIENDLSFAILSAFLHA
jgi:hypothetical protein